MTVIPTRQQPPQIARASSLAVRRVPAAPGRGEGGLTGRDVLRVLRKRKWLIFFSLVICISLSVLATLLWLQYAPLYTSSAMLEVRPQETTRLRPEREVVPTDWLSSLAAKYVSLTLSESVLQAAISTDRVRNTTWFQKSPDDAIQRLVDELSVAAQPGSALIVISLTGTRKTELPEIVNAVAEAAQNRSMELATSGTQDQIRQLRTERASLDEQRDRVRAEKAKLLRDADVPDMLERTNVLTMKLHSLAPQVTALELELAQADGSLQLIKKQIQTGEVANLPQVLQAMDLDPALRTLQTSLLNLRAQKENLLRKFGPRHRAVLNYDSRLKSIEEQVASRRQQLIDAQVKSMLANAEARKAIVLERLTKLREQYRFVDVSVRGLRATYSAYTQLDAQDKGLTEQIDRIDNRLVDLRILLKGNSPLVVMQMAHTPRRPSMPKWTIMIPLGVLLGLAVGLGLSFMLEFIDTSVKGPSDIGRRIDLPLLGMIPHQDDLEEDIKDLRLAFSTHPNSLISEAFRQVRTCLLYSGPASQRRSLLITSPQPSDGRTTVTLNLAASIARGGHKVLVVDANFRQPMIRRLFADCPEGGLSSALVGQASWRDMVSQVEPNLYVMAAGPLPPNPGELLGSEQMGKVIEEMVGEYDQVIFDSAPCILVNDAPALSTLVDAAILVVRAGANTFGIVQRAREMLDRIGGHVIGVVLNGVRAMAGGYLRKNYEAFYDYHEQAKLPKK
ncbi:MAG: polysaccharide biosynthesis tyrosine autokinase [Planctomycetes bacterium]|nr:polysaccharide biosynthesis tyrosine autokinase [Planctomycetota bacterium]